MLDYELYRLHSADLRREAEQERLTRAADTSRRRREDRKDREGREAREERGSDGESDRWVRAA